MQIRLCRTRSCFRHSAELSFHPGLPCKLIRNAAAAVTRGSRRGVSCFMFNGFAHVWTPALVARRLKRKPLRVVIAGEPIVFFRSVDGTIGALSDRCPHRAAALSLGQVGADGCLEC